MSVDLLKRFISFPTVSRDPITEFASELAERSEKLGGTVQQFHTNENKQNVVVQFGNSDEDGLGLCGHMDVVPIDGQNWTVDPFQGTVVNGRIVGRGSCDMKAFFAAVYSILERLQIHKMRRGITLIWTHDEEVGCVGASHLPKQIGNSILPKHIIIGEPTDQKIFHHHGGHCTIEFVIKGQPAHSSKPHLGVSASVWMYELWSCIREWQVWLSEHPSPITNTPPITNISQLNCGTAVNIIPEHGFLQIGLRPMPGHKTTVLLQNLRERIHELNCTAKESGAMIKMNIIQSAPPLFTPIPTELSNAIKLVNPNTQCEGAPFATDGGCLAEMGCTPLIWGPGSIDVAHQANEHVKIESLLNYEHQLETLIRQWCFHQ